MTLTKQNKMLLGLGVLGVAAYLIWKQNQEKQNFISRSRSRGRATNLMSEFGDRPPRILPVLDTPIVEYMQKDACKEILGCTKGGNAICNGIDGELGVHHWSKNTTAKSGSTCKGKAILSDALCGGCDK
jgi:hypothetical protein